MRGPFAIVCVGRLSTLINVALAHAFLSLAL